MIYFMYWIYMILAHMCKRITEPTNITLICNIFVVIDLHFDFNN